MDVEFVKLSEIHLEMVRNWRNSPEVSKYMYTNQYISEQDQVSWFEKVKDDSTKAYWVIKIGDKYVGVVNLYDIMATGAKKYIDDPTKRSRFLQDISRAVSRYANLSSFSVGGEAESGRYTIDGVTE